MRRRFQKPSRKDRQLGKKPIDKNPDGYTYVCGACHREFVTYYEMNRHLSQHPLPWTWGKTVSESTHQVSYQSEGSTVVTQFSPTSIILID